MLREAERTVAGWDADPDWELRVRSREWWLEHREASTNMDQGSPDRRLLHASDIGAAPWVDALIDDQGASVAARNEAQKRWTPLHHAAARGACRTISALLARGADLHAIDDDKSPSPSPFLRTPAPKPSSPAPHGPARMPRTAGSP